MKFPFEVEFEEILADQDTYVDAVISTLASEFLTLPRGDGFVEYPHFEAGYEALKKATAGFANLEVDTILEVAARVPITLIVLRSILGFTPPEWAYLACQRTRVTVSQGFVRGLDRNIRLDPLKPLRVTEVTGPRVRALVQTACEMIAEGCPTVEPHLVHRLQKADTLEGLHSVENISTMGVPYAMLLYERFLGRPFAGHRDSVSDLVGHGLEALIESVLDRYGVGYRKTKRAERIQGFDQAPDFIVPDEFSPHVVIEAKITEDDGTARDKVTRIQHLGELSLQGAIGGKPRFQVVACIGGRGFGVRREDMKKLLLATRGKVFTPNTLQQLVDYTDLARFRTK